MRAISLSILLILPAIITTGCATTTTEANYLNLVRSITAADVSAFEKRHGGRITSEEITEMKRLVDRLVAEQTGFDDINVHVLKSNSPNAFALATGNIYITTGLFDLICTEDELAAVLAHELAHIEEMSEFSAIGGADRDKLLVEADADARALNYLIDSGFDPAALAIMIERLEDEQPPGWAHHRTDQLSYLLTGQHNPDFCE